MSRLIPVLDHGFVRLVSYMQPAERDKHWTGDLEIVRNARVSYNADWRTGEDAGKDEKLIQYLYKNRHTSPFEAMVFTFEVKAPIFVLRQWHRHRTWSYNEISARYSELDEGFYVPEPGKYGVQSSSNKQVRELSDGDCYTAEEWSKFLRWEEEQREHMIRAFELYQRHLKEGMPRELARIVLPFAAYSRMFATVDLHNLFHFLRLRVHPHSQYEIRQYALAIWTLIREIVPCSASAFEQFKV